VIEDKFDSNHRHEHENHLVTNGRKHSTLLDLKIGCNSLRNQVKAVGVVAVREIINVVSSYRINSIIKSSHVCSLTGTSEICLQSRRACV
jgi:phage FluMu protein gp41